MRPSSVRLFMVPGMGHCGGGDGASTFNMVAALDAWVERGTAPEQIPASRVRNGDRQSDAAALRLSALRPLLGNGKRRRCRELQLRHAVDRGGRLKPALGRLKAAPTAGARAAT